MCIRTSPHLGPRFIRQLHKLRIAEISLASARFFFFFFYGCAVWILTKICLFICWQRSDCYFLFNSVHLLSLWYSTSCKNWRGQKKKNPHSSAIIIVSLSFLFIFYNNELHSWRSCALWNGVRIIITIALYKYITEHWVVVVNSWNERVLLLLNGKTNVYKIKFAFVFISSYLVAVFYFSWFSLFLYYSQSLHVRLIGSAV